MKYLRIFFLTVASMMFFLIAYGQKKDIGLPDIKNYEKSDYQSGTQNWDIDQDKNGNVYFANNNGLIQFDGTTWRNYNVPNTDNIRSVKIDNNSGRIYVGGYNEFGYFESDSLGGLVYKSLLEIINNENDKKSDFIWRIHIINDEVIFQSFFRIYILKDNRIKTIEAPYRFQFSFHVGNKLYIQDISEGILKYEKGLLFPLKGTKVLNNSEIWGIFDMPNDKLLLATLEKGLFIYENDSVTPWNTEANTFIKKNSSLGGVAAMNKSIVLNSVLDGIIICDLNGKIIQHINLKKGLQNNTVLNSFIDSKNNLWLGLDNGISFININSPFTYFGSSHNLGTVYASAVHNGLLYVATNQGVFYRRLNSSILDNTFALVEGTTAQSWNIQVIEDELICANNRGAMIIERDKVTEVLDEKGYYGFKEIPNQSNVVIGSNYGGFAAFEKTKSGLKFKNQIEGFDKSSNFFELDDSFLWLERDQVLYQMEFSNDFKTFSSVKSISSLNENNDKISTLQKINGEVYFQSNNRFYTYSRAQDQFFEDKRLSSAFENTSFISSLTEDTSGNLWYLYDESLGVMMKNDSKIYNNVLEPFSNLTGKLVENYLSVNWVDANNIFIGLINGLAHYDSEFSETNKTKPNLFIRSFSYADNTFFQGNPQENIFEHEIPYKSNNVKFTFSSPDFENINNVSYAYQLEPFENNWSNWSKISIKEYTNLKEGDYKMKVKVKNNYGIESEVEVLTFSVLPPWYRHYLAYTAYFLIILIVIYLLSLIQKARLRKKQYYHTIEQRKIYLEKESKIRNEQYELEKEIEKLNRDKLQTKILAKDKELVNNSLQVVKTNKILNRIIRRLKEMDDNSMNEETKFQLTKLKKSIIKEVKTDRSWTHLEKHIKNVHFEFLKRLKENYPNITPRELDLSTYLLLNMSTKEIAEVLNISSGGVELARYRLRKKLGLKRKESLTGFLMNI